MTRPKAQTAPFSAIEAEYPNQYNRMVDFLRSQGIAENDRHDLINDAWLQAMETFDSSRGLTEIQWAWWVLQHNMIPGYYRARAKRREDRLPEEFEVEDASNAALNLSEELTGFLENRLARDLNELFHVLLQIIGNTASQHVFNEVSQRLDIPMKECRNRMKRLRRACHKLKSQWEEQQ